jgi:uncharacterized membrane protein
MGNKTHSKNNRQQAKRQMVVKEEKKGGKSLFAGLGVALAAVIAAAFFVFSGGDGFKVVSAEAGVVRIPLSEVNDGKAHFYKFNGGGKAINFFVLRSSDGVVRAAFDACDVCFRERKGYRQEGDIMVCNNCGQRFPSVKINELKGGCNPAPLFRRAAGEHLVLNAADILQGGFYF